MHRPSPDLTFLALPRSNIGAYVPGRVKKRTRVETPPKIVSTQRSQRHPSGPVLERYPAKMDLILDLKERDAPRVGPKRWWPKTLHCLSSSVRFPYICKDSAHHKRRRTKVPPSSRIMIIVSIFCARAQPTSVRVYNPRLSGIHVVVQIVQRTTI